MKSEWRVGYRMAGVSLEYCAYRLINRDALDTPANREYDRNWYHRRTVAEKAVEYLNGEKGA